MTARPRHVVAKGQHVIPVKGKWSVIRSGARKATARYPTLEEAIERAAGIARRERGILYIHDENWHIRDRRTFGDEPYPLAV